MSLPPVIRQSACYALGIFATKGVSLLMVPVFTRHLAPADYDVEQYSRHRIADQVAGLLESVCN